MSLALQNIFLGRGLVSPAVSRLKVKSADLILFTTQLSIMLESGVVLSDALEGISEQEGPGIFKAVIHDIAERIKNGDSLSVALANYPRIFNSMFISMVKASEASGKMPEMLDVLASYLNAEAETRKQIKGAMIYPLIMLLMAIAATGSLMFFVLPRFSKIYESRGATLPKLTQLLVDFSNMLGDIRIMVSLGFTLGVLYFLLQLWRQTITGQKFLDWFKVRTPVIGVMFIDAVMTRGMRIMATMVNTGVSLLDALEVVHSSCDNFYFRSLWLSTDNKIRDGYQLSDSILLSPYNRLVAAPIIQMIRAGEKSGQIGQVCDKISIFYQKKLQNSIRIVTSLIEPVMIIFMGVVVGTIAIALLLPVFRISSIMAH
jgi:type IV pilus assembly protein PilC